MAPRKSMVLGEMVLMDDGRVLIALATPLYGVECYSLIEYRPDSTSMVMARRMSEGSIMQLLNGLVQAERWA